MSQILVIEDNPITQIVVADLLARRGHQCVIANNGREGLDKLSGHEIDLVITDIIMPEQEGLETIIAIRRSNSDLPIIAMSGSFCPISIVSSIDYLKIAAALGANARLNKPFSAHQFYEELDRLLPLSLMSSN